MTQERLKLVAARPPPQRPSFNDDHGHHVGDQLLRMVGSKLAKVGEGGRAFRYGGEEFAVLFPSKSVEEALLHLETCRAAIEASSFTVRGRRRSRERPHKPRTSAGLRKAFVTVSIGAADADRRGAAADQVIQEADAALRRAKRAGRNRVRT